MNRIAKVGYIAAAFILALSGCGHEVETMTIYKTDNIIVERTGNTTTVYEAENNSKYEFKTHKSRISKENIKPEDYSSKAVLIAETDSMRLETVYNLIILQDKEQMETFYIK